MVVRKRPLHSDSRTGTHEELGWCRLYRRFCMTRVTLLLFLSLCLYNSPVILWMRDPDGVGVEDILRRQRPGCLGPSEESGRGPTVEGSRVTGEGRGVGEGDLRSEVR